MSSFIKDAPVEVIEVNRKTSVYLSIIKSQNKYRRKKSG